MEKCKEVFLFSNSPFKKEFKSLNILVYYELYCDCLYI